MLAAGIDIQNHLSQATPTANRRVGGSNHMITLGTCNYGSIRTFWEDQEKEDPWTDGEGG